MTSSIDDTGGCDPWLAPNLAHKAPQTAGKRSSRETEVQLKVRDERVVIGTAHGHVHVRAHVGWCGVRVARGWYAVCVESGLHFGRFRTRAITAPPASRGPPSVCERARVG